MTPHSHEHTHDEDDPFLIGHGIGPVGRWLRLFLGLYFLAFLVLNPLYLQPVPQAETTAFALTVGGYMLLIAVVYFVVFYLIGGPVLSRMHPWTGTVIFLGIPAALALLGLLPQPVQLAFGVYISGSLVLIFFMRYGGCEVIALPSLLLGRRYTMYCPFNAIDAVERAVTPDRLTARHRVFAILSLAIVIFVGGYFLLVELHVLRQEPMGFDIDTRWSLLLLVPLVQFTALALRYYLAERNLLAPGVRRFGLGAAVLALAIATFLFDRVSWVEIWVAAMGIGALFVLVQLGAQLANRPWLRPSS